MKSHSGEQVNLLGSCFPVKGMYMKDFFHISIPFPVKTGKHEPNKLLNGDTEKFYAKYYAEIPLNSGKYFKGLSRNASTLLSTKVADCMLVYCKQL